MSSEIISVGMSVGTVACFCTPFGNTHSLLIGCSGPYVSLPRFADTDASLDHCLSILTNERFRHLPVLNVGAKRTSFGYE
jgi:hypothetical protein